MGSEFIQPQNTEMIMYQTEDGLTKIDVHPDYSNLPDKFSHLPQLLQNLQQLNS